MLIFNIRLKSNTDDELRAICSRHSSSHSWRSDVTFLMRFCPQDKETENDHLPLEKWGSCYHLPCENKSITEIGEHLPLQRIPEIEIKKLIKIFCKRLSSVDFYLGYVSKGSNEIFQALQWDKSIYFYLRTHCIKFFSVLEYTGLYLSVFIVLKIVSINIWWPTIDHVLRNLFLSMTMTNRLLL